LTKKLLLLPGDGIGPEVARETRRVIDWMIAERGLGVEVVEHKFGGAAFDEFGDPFPASVRELVRGMDAVLLGAVGGPKWTEVPREMRPEAGLLRLRAAMEVYANLRPALVFDSLVDASPLKPELVKGLDIIFVRELTGGVYFGQPRGISTLADGSRRGVDTAVYTTGEIERVARRAFELARTRQKVTSVDKSNVMESGLLWREVVTALHASDYPDVRLDHMYADNAAMQLVRNPRQFDVILTDNLFGDVLSDEAAMLTGSIGLLPSAALGASGGPGLYEPIHGSAPDIAGRGTANPIAMILSLGMALRWSLERPDLAEAVMEAVAATLEGGTRTADLGGSVATAAMGAAILARLQH
jgi:3-isopropylmalate dehydrogenase